MGRGPPELVPLLAGVHHSLSASSFVLDSHQSTARVFDKSQRAEAETFLKGGRGHLLLVNALAWATGPHPRASILLETTVGDESYLLLASPHPPGDPPHRLPGETASSSL